MTAQVLAAMRDVNKIFDSVMLNPDGRFMREGLANICGAAMIILFFCLLVKFVVDILNSGYSFDLFTRYFLQMMILGAIISPFTFPALAGIYVNFFEAMMRYIGAKEIDELRSAMLAFFEHFAYEESLVRRLFAFVTGIELLPVKLWLPMAAYSLFIISVYLIFMLPIVLCFITLLLAPILLALSPLFTDMITKLCSFLFGLGVVYPVILFGLGTFLPVSITIISELLLEENMILLFVISTAYAFVIAYSLPVIGYLSGLSFISELRVIFPAAWFEYVFCRPVAVVMKTIRRKK